MRVLITGGAGFLGINLVRYLLRKGHAEIISLDLAPFDYPESDRIRCVKGDIRDPACVEPLVRDVDVVVHAAAALPLYARDDIFSTDVDGTRNLLRACERSGTERFVFVSSTAVYGIPDHHPILEEDPLQGVGPYGEAKIAAEKLCLEYRERGMCVPIIRPKSFIGPERLGVFSLLYEWADDGRNFPVLGKGDNRYQLLDVEDLCEAIHICLTSDREAVNDTFNVGAAEFATIKEDFQSVLDYAGHGKRIVPTPAGPVICVLKFLEFLKLSPLYKWVYETAGKDSFVSVRKARERLGFTPRFSNREALIRNFRWYREHRDEFAGKTGISHRAPWKQGALRMLKSLF